MSVLSLTARLLRDPASVVAEHEQPELVAVRVPQLLLIAVVGAAIFGLVAGSYRGGLQLVYAALKAPLLLLIPLLVALPAVRGLAEAVGQPQAWSAVALAGLSAMARTAVLAAATSPVLWLLYSLDTDYHLAVLLLAGTLAVTGLPGLGVLASSLTIRGWGPRLVVALGTLAVLGPTLAQTGWLLRPFVARPTTEVALFRPVEEDVFTALGTTALSAVGIYGDWEARPAGFVGRTLSEGDR